ncbi:NAD(P)-binding domain-containing protein [Aquabacterium humicola]|uniref:NAD(P)-binding domain-containing protein n=1 Tax=Aquabacterium humicola TaxID=3237377 RepID=UPI0025436874|nr:NAD(P)-binding domain-containing protein [Rubrivivax pictus]
MNWLPLYAVALALVLAFYVVRRQRQQRAHAAELQQALEAGLIEPPSLHPVVDPLTCIGSGSCVKACPEGALGMVGGKATLVNAAACIGHGACHAACPFEAIRLVFGTERRGIDIPDVSPQFESNVPGLFIAGELGGMGLIRKAAEQGRQAVDAIRRRGGSGFELDVVIVGCGPAGLSAGLACIEHGLRYKLLEQEDSLGGAVFHYPRQKIAMTAPVKLAVVGQVRFGEVQKEALLEFWNGVVDKTGLRIEFRECLQDIVADGEGFVVHTQQHAYRTRCVLLAMGRRGTPRKLDVPGEDSPKVCYRLIDAAQYGGQRVLVVGGGDSALEAALALAAEPGTTVTLSYRSEAFSRVKARNRDALQLAQRDGRIEVLLSSQVEAIAADRVTLRLAEGRRELPNDAVIVCAGGLLPTPLLQKVGIRFETKFGTA